MKGLKDIRKERNLTQVTLAERLGVTQSNVAMWETGAAWPGGPMILKIANELHCTIDALYGREPPQEPPDAAAS